MKDAMDVLCNRRSCKRFLSDMIKKEDLDFILKAGENSPSGMGKQSPIILAITNRELRDKLSKLNGDVAGFKPGFDPFYNAPVVLVVLADKRIPTYIYDGSVVIGNLLNAASCLDLGSCWIHRAKEEFENPVGKEILKRLNLDPEVYEGIGHCVLGYRDESEKRNVNKKSNYVYYID